jgi:XRE family transcriptional regulator, regulator of sulfur utilization
MKISRRDLSLLLPALAGRAAAQPRQTTTLESKVYQHAQLPYAGDDKKKGRRFLFGPNRSGFNIEMHETILGPGTSTHQPHKHAHEEAFILVEGTLEAHLEGKTQVMEAGSIFYVASNQMHTVNNAGKVPARYYIIELRGPQA